MCHTCTDVGSLWTSAASEAQSGWIVKVGLINQKKNWRQLLWNTAAEQLLSAFAANTVDLSFVPRVPARPCYDNVACNWTHLMGITLPPVATWNNKRPGLGCSATREPVSVAGSLQRPSDVFVGVVPTFFMRADKAVKRNHKQYYVDCWTGLFSCLCCSVLLTGFFFSISLFYCERCGVTWGKGISPFSEAAPYGFPTCGFKFSLDHFGCPK